LIVSIAVIFELLFSNKANATDFLFIQLKNTGIVQLALPVIVAYLYYTMLYSWIESQVLQDIGMAVFEKTYPDLYKAGGELLLYPPNSLIGSMDRTSGIIGEKSTKGRMMYWSGGLKVLVLVFGAPVFLVVAYSQLFSRYGITDAALWTSLLFSVVLLLAASVPFYIGATDY
jgi:hypothetical protein